MKVASLRKNLSLNDNNEELSLLGTALSSPVRIDILKAINRDKPIKLYELSKLCHVSISSIQFHVKILCAAKLARIESVKKNKKEIQYVRSYLRNVNIDFTEDSIPSDHKIGTIYVPIGIYRNIEGYERGAILLPDATPSELFSVDSYKAILIWIDKGTIEYRLNTGAFTENDVEAMEIAFEYCSEAPGYNENWPSNITYWINDIELHTYTVKGDYGGRKGRHTPIEWPITRTQFGEWNILRVDREGTYFNGTKVSNIKLDELGIFSGDSFLLKIGNKPDAKNKGGISIMGKGFGDYNSDIEISFFGK